MYKIENRLKQDLDIDSTALIADFNAGRLSVPEMTAAFGAVTTKYTKYWANIQSHTLVKQTADILIAELPQRQNQMILTGDRAVSFEMDLDLTDDECLAVLNLVTTRDSVTTGCDFASAYTEAGFGGKPRKIIFCFESQLPIVLPRHIAAVEALVSSEKAHAMLSVTDGKSRNQL